MNRILLFCALGVLWGCRAANEATTDPITLSSSTSAHSKSGGLTAGDEVAVFARVEGTESYFLEGAKYGVGSDGHSLTYGSTVYYPEAKQAVQFYAYFPYHTGTFSVPTDQSTATALKQADLCWANASSTPVATPVSLEFQHLFARLIVQANEPTEQIACTVVPSGTLDPVTSHFTLSGTQSDVSTTGNELIVPAQPLTRLVLTVAGKEYPFTPTSAVTLPAGQTTVLHLTLHPISQTATLAAPVVTTANWTATSATDEPGQAVNNQFTAHWLVADYRFNQINKISLTIKDQTTAITKDYTVSGVSLAAGSTVAAASYTFALSNLPDLHYPYTVSAIKFYQDAVLVHTASVTNAIVRPGAATLGWGQSISLTLSAATTSVAATATSSTFTVTSNVPYASTYTAGGASAQGVGAQPPYTAYSVTFTYPAQGSSAAAVRTHVMTITPTEDYTGNPNRRTFTVTQAAVPTSLSLSATAPGETVQEQGKIYTVNVTSNTSWKSQNAVNGVTTNPPSGVGNITGVEVIIPFSLSSSTHTVSVDFVTTAALSGVAEKTVKWSGTQAAGPGGVVVGNVLWATGNLVASSSTAGKAGFGGCKIGAPGDGGLYFQFGSLIGYKGGSTGSGTGMPSKTNGTYWNGSGYSWASDAMVWPTELVGTKTSWTNTTGSSISTLSDYYFNYSVAPWETASKNIREFDVSISGDSGSGTLSTGRYAKKGVGDPCTYYLGGTWRLPTTNEYVALCNNKSGINANFSWADAGGSWTTSPTYGGNIQGTKLFFPASGFRDTSNGSFYNVTTHGFRWSSSVGTATLGLHLSFYSSWVCPQNTNTRSYGLPVRCVSSVP